jgi:hypothetical protein
MPAAQATSAERDLRAKMADVRKSRRCCQRSDQIMLSSDETKAGGKPNPRKAKAAQDGGDKAKQRKRTAAAQVPETDQPQRVPETDQPQSVPETISETVAVTETTALPSPADPSPMVPAVAEESAPVSYRTIADAWGNYSRTSLDQTRSYLEKLAGARSLGAAFEVQAEFAKQACETFVAESRRIGELQGELAKQRVKRLEGLMKKMTQGALGARHR